MTSAPNAVLDLVERFDSQLDAYRSGRYKETPVRHDFIDPLFEALGWDINNRAGYAEAYRDVIHEDAIKVGGVTKAPDYCFRVGGRRIFFLEAKKPSVDIATDVHPAYQLRRYAWSAKLPLSILTDFEEFAVYDCRIRPKPADKAAVARTMYLKFTEYTAKWDQIESVFARQSVLKGSFDKYVASSKKRGTAEVDAEFLKEIEKWRDALARNIALRNPRLNVRELNFAVQRTIDRIIFLRMAEGRGIERYASLQALISGQKVYARLMEMFHAADDRYNSGLFHFRQNDPGHTGPPDELTPEIKIDDKVLSDIFKGVYYPASPYEFSVLGADILGNVYEQFLGKVIRLTAGHHARVEEKPEVKKAGGVYYTPKYIVDYIVKQTVGRLLLKEDVAQPPSAEQEQKNDVAQPPSGESPQPGAAALQSFKTPQEIGGLTDNFRPSKARAPLRVLDPACGSGSFLVGAYKFLMDYHRDWYLAADPGLSGSEGDPSPPTGSRLPATSPGSSRATGSGLPATRPGPYPATGSRLPATCPGASRADAGSTDTPTLRPTKYADKIYQGMGGQWYLTTAEKKRILLSNIYGVDIDSQAVEVTKLNLLLCMLENENQGTIESQLKMWHERALPDLGANIKCGNSLIGPDFYQGKQMPLFDEEARYRINAFDWPAEFPDILGPKAGKNLGFDAVIGNPPYLRQESLQEYKEYFAAHYESYQATADLYVYFMELGLRLLRSGGRYGIIVSSSFLYTAFAGMLRSHIRGTSAILRVVDFGGLAVFEKAKDTYVCIPLLAKAPQPDEVRICKVSSLESTVVHAQRNYSVPATRFGRGTWSIKPQREIDLFTKICNAGIRLKEFVGSDLCRGVTTGLNEAFVIDQVTRARLIDEEPGSEELIKPLLGGQDIRRYSVRPSEDFLLFTRRGIDIDEYPAVKRHLQRYRKALEPKPKGWSGAWPGRKPGEYKWYEIQDSVDYYRIFERPKIMYPDITKGPRFHLDTKGSYATNTAYCLGEDSPYLLGILNSRLFWFAISNSSIPFGTRGGQYRYRLIYRYMAEVPIRKIEPSDPSDKARHDQMVELVESMLNLHKDLAAAKTAHDKEVIQRQIDSTDNQIDQLVYELYGLSVDEIRIVEEATK